MQIVELSDYSMVIMKDSEDPWWGVVGNVYRHASKYGKHILVDIGQLTYHYLESSEFIYTAGRLILFFKDPIPPRFHLHDKVILEAVTPPYNN